METPKEEPFSTNIHIEGEEGFILKFAEGKDGKLYVAGRFREDGRSDTFFVSKDRFNRAVAEAYEIKRNQE